MDKLTRRNADKDSISNGERESIKEDSPTKNSLDEENETREKAAFLTESPNFFSPVGRSNTLAKIFMFLDKQIRIDNHDDSSLDDQDDDALSQRSEEKNREKLFKKARSPKGSPNKKQKYDPRAILEKLKNKEPLVDNSSSHDFINNRMEGNLSSRNDLPKTSTNPLLRIKI